MRKIIIAILVILLSGCVSTSEQSSVIEVNDPLRIVIFHDESKQEFASNVKRQLDSTIQVSQQKCEKTCEIKGHPDLIIAIGPQVNQSLETSIPLLRVFEHEPTIVEKVSYLKENSNYQDLVTVDFEIEGLEMLKSDSQFQETLKKRNPDAVILFEVKENLKIDVPVVLSQHPQNRVDVIVDEIKTIEEIKRVSALILNNQGFQEQIPLYLMIR